MFNFLITIPWLLATTITAPVPPSSPPSAFDSDGQRSLEPVVKIQYNNYAVSGSTVSEIQDQMFEQGPLDPLEQQRYAANTDWHVNWSYKYAMTDQGCKVTSFKANVDIVFTLPQWSTPHATSASLVESWNEFLAALQIHENGHMMHGIATGQAVLYGLSQLPAYESCEALQMAANTTARSIIHYYNRLDIDYDAATRHGFVQGAVFPPVQPSASQR